MAHVITVKYERPVIRKALNRYMLERLGMKFFLLLAAAVGILLLSYFADIWNWFFSLVVAILVAAVAFLVFIYFARLRTAEAFFDKGGEPIVTYYFDDSGVRTESHLGSASLKWEVFDEILKFSDVWLLVYAKSGYMTLPLAQFTDECRHFIDARINNSQKTS